MKEVKLATKERISTLRAEWERSPEGDGYQELCELLAQEKETRPEGREICFRVITANQADLVARLALARMFYLDGYYEFCIRELVEVYSRSEAPAVKKLLDAFGAHAAPFLVARSRKPPVEAVADKAVDAAEVVAEIDIDDEFLEAIDGLK